jgi:fumarate reductase subunit D
MVWGLFSLGGFITAFLLPVVMFVSLVAVPSGLWPADRIGFDAYATRFADPLFRIFLLVLIGGSLFHGMHRLRHILLDTRLRRADPLLIVVCYGIAALGSLVALYYTILADWFGIRVPFL